MSGKVPSGDVRLTLNVRKELHRNLKMAGVMTETTMGELVEMLIKDKLNEILQAGIRKAKKG